MPKIVDPEIKFSDCFLSFLFKLKYIEVEYNELSQPYDYSELIIDEENEEHIDEEQIDDEQIDEKIKQMEYKISKIQIREMQIKKLYNRYKPIYDDEEKKNYSFVEMKESTYNIVNEDKERLVRALENLSKKNQISSGDIRGFYVDIFGRGCVDFYKFKSIIEKLYQLIIQTLKESNLDPNPVDILSNLYNLGRFGPEVNIDRLDKEPWLPISRRYLFSMRKYLYGDKIDEMLVKRTIQLK